MSNIRIRKKNYLNILNNKKTRIYVLTFGRNGSNYTNVLQCAQTVSVSVDRYGVDMSPCIIPASEGSDIVCMTDNTRITKT